MSSPIGLRGPLLLALLCSCDPLESFRGAPSLETTVEADTVLVVHPTSLDFGTIPVDGGSVMQLLNLENPGDTDLTVYGHDQPIGLYGDDTSVFEFETNPLVSLAPGESLSVPVVFTPRTDGIWEAVLEVNPGRQTILIRGSGAAPVIGVGPTSPATAAIGCTEDTSLRIANQGSMPLELTDITLDDPWDAWRVETNLLPATIEPGGHVEVPATFAPGYADDTYGTRPASVIIDSNDPATPVSSVPLSGEAEQLTLVRERFTYAVSNDIDLLVVADTSYVVQTWLPNVKTALAPLVFGLEDAGASLQTAVVTGGSPCPTTTPAYSDATTPLEQRVDLFSTGLSADAGTAYNQLGVLTSNSLANVETGRCLDGFLRPGSRLHVLLVAGVADVAEYDAEQQVNLIRDMLDEEYLLDETRFKVSALMGTDASICLGAVWSNTYYGIVERTGGTVVNLCSSELGIDIRAIRDNALQGLEAAYAHPLGRSPVPESIRVTIDGAPWTHFEYRADDNTVLFDGPDIPSVNSSVDIEYREQLDCTPAD